MKGYNGTRGRTAPSESLPRRPPTAGGRAPGTLQYPKRAKRQFLRLRPFLLYGRLSGSGHGSQPHNPRTRSLSHAHFVDTPSTLSRPGPVPPSGARGRRVPSGSDPTTPWPRRTKGDPEDVCPRHVRDTLTGPDDSNEDGTVLQRYRYVGVPVGLTKSPTVPERSLPVFPWRGTYEILRHCGR